jgi:uncharacterized protein YndB with AHSA1/START domain
MTTEPPPGDAPDAAPIAHEYRLRCSPERAFAAYAGQIGRWWHPLYTANPETLQAVTIEPRVGGRVFATHGDLGEVDWGRVTTWEPGRRLAYTSVLAQDRAHPSEIRVDFLPDDGGCLVRFAHGGWHAANAPDRKKFGDWPRLLERFVALAEGG